MKLELILKKGDGIMIKSVIYCDPKEEDRIRIWKEILTLFDSLK